MSKPVLIRRNIGGWLAVSTATEPIKIGVIASTEVEAEQNYNSALRRWQALEISAANTRTSEQTSA